MSRRSKPIRSLPFAVTLAFAAAKPVFAQAELEVLPAQGNVFMIAGPGGNTTVQIGHEAVVVVDTQTAAVSDELLAAIAKLSSKPIRHIINTSADAEHTGGNEAVSRAGTYVRLIDTFDPRGQRSEAGIIAHVNVLARMSSPTGTEAPARRRWPSDTYFTEEWALFVNGEALQLIHVPEAHTDGDTIVFFRRSDVISHGRHLQHVALSAFRRGAGRQRRRSHRRPESDPRYRDPRREPGRRHGRDPRPRTAQRRDRSRELPGHGDDRPRPRRRDDRGGMTLQQVQAATADERLRRNLRRAEWLDRCHVRRRGVPRSRGSEHDEARRDTSSRLRFALAVLLSVASVAANVSAVAQPPPGPPDTRSPRERAPIDITGQWVAVVNEDWRWRMVTPPVGDTASLPVNERGRAAAAAWDLERDKAEGSAVQGVRRARAHAAAHAHSHRMGG